MKIQIKIIFKKLLLFLFYVFLLIFYMILAEVALRAKNLGIRGAIQSISKNDFEAKSSSALGTNGWVISDSDLNYRLNPSQSGVNIYSMREKQIEVPKPKGVVRIVVLGDSIPFVGDPTFVDVLKNKFSSMDKVEILNASTPGYTTYQEMLFLEKYLIKAEPDFVILSYCLNDNYKFLHIFDQNSEMLLTNEAEVSLRIKSPVDRFINNSYFLSSLKLALIKNTNNPKKSMYPWDDQVDFNMAWKDFSWPDFSDHLTEMKNILEKNNAKLFVVAFPLEEQFIPHLLNVDYQRVTYPQRQVDYYSKKINIPYLNLFQAFYDHIQMGQKLYTDGLHLSNDGINLTADSIYNFLLSNDDFRKRIFGEND
jgi:hypothetical protein